MQNIDWDKMAAPWLKAETVLEQTHESVLKHLMARADLKPGQRVLDVGCGTGFSTIEAANAVGPVGGVVAVDISPPLVARTRERTPDTVEVVVADAGTLTYDRPFDVAISSFGTMFFADTAAAFANLRKALSRGRRFVFSAWGPPPKNPWFGIPRAAVEAQMGPLPKPDPSAPGPFRFADAAATGALLETAGWSVDVNTEAVVLRTGHSAGKVAEMHLMIAEALMLADREVTDADRTAIRTNLAEGFAGMESDGQVDVPATVHIFTATAA